MARCPCKDVTEIYVVHCLKCVELCSFEFLPACLLPYATRGLHGGSPGNRGFDGSLSTASALFSKDFNELQPARQRSGTLTEFSFFFLVINPRVLLFLFYGL